MNLEADKQTAVPLVKFTHAFDKQYVSRSDAGCACVCVCVMGTRCDWTLKSASYSLVESGHASSCSEGGMTRQLRQCLQTERQTWAQLCIAHWCVNAELAVQ